MPTFTRTQLGHKIRAWCSVLNFITWNGKVHIVNEFRCHTPSSDPIEQKEHFGFVVDKVALELIFLRVQSFSLSLPNYSVHLTRK